MGKIKTKRRKKSQAVLEQSKFPYQKYRIWWTDPTNIRKMEKLNG